MDETRLKARQLRNAATDAERRLWQFLRSRQLGGFRFRRQAPIAGYIADFVCPELKLVIELDGGQHLEQSDYDAHRTLVLERHGYRVLRYWNNDALAATADVLADVLRTMEERESTPPRPSPTLRAREGANPRLSSAPASQERLSPALASEEELCSSPSLAQQGRAGEGCFPKQETQK